MAILGKDQTKILEEIAHQIASLTDQIANNQETMMEILRSMQKQEEFMNILKSIERKEEGSHMDEKRIKVTKNQFKKGQTRAISTYSNLQCPKCGRNMILHHVKLV